MITKLFEVWIWNGTVFKCSVYVLCPMHLTDQLVVKKKDGFHLSGIQMAFTHWTIWHPTSFRRVRYSDPNSTLFCYLCVLVVVEDGDNWGWICNGNPDTKSNFFQATEKVVYMLSHFINNRNKLTVGIWIMNFSGGSNIKHI